MAESAITRTGRGLTIAGTRITLYSILDYLHAGWPAKLIRDRLNLADDQIADALEYIEAHKAEVEAEYQQVVRDAEDSRKYWEERSRERIAEIAARPARPEQAAIRAKLAAAKARLGER